MNITKRLITLCLGLILCCFGSCSKKNEQGGSVTSFSGSFVNRGRPAADLANYRIAYYEPADGESDFAGGVIQESDDPFIITDFGPRDILPKEIIKPSIYVNFSQPVVPLAKLGEPIREGAGLFTIEPPLAGVYRWYGSRLLSFEPAADIPQQRYTITVSDRITSLGGKSLEGERSFNFETDRLSVLEWRLGQEDRWVTTGNADPDDARHIRLIFSHPVNLAEIARWIEIWAGGRTWPFTLERLQNIDERRYRAEQGVLITIKDKFPLNTEVVMELKEGACSEPGWLGTLETMAWTYHTLLPFRFENISVNSYSRPRTGEGDYISISLEFSQPVEPDGAERSFSVDGFSALRKDNVNVYGSTVVINRLPLAHQQRYTVRIAAGLKDLYGRVLGRSEQVEAQTGEAESYVYFLNRGPRMLEAGFPANIIWEMQNPVALSSRIDAAQGPYERLPPSGMTAMNLSRFSPNTKRHFMEDLSPFLNAAGKGTATMRWDYKTKSSWQRGIVYSGDTWLTVQVTNIGITVRYAHNMVLVWATHLSDGTPAADTVVELLESERIILSGVTDAQGLAVFEFPGSSIASRFTEPYSSVWDTETTGKGLRIRVTEGQGRTRDQAEFIPNDSHNLWRFTVEAMSNPFEREQERPVIFLFTDRGLYRPGETVTFRGIDRILRQGNFEAYQGPYEIEARSAANNYYDNANQEPVIVLLNGESTANGGSYGSFTLPAAADPGQYRLIYRRGRIETAVSFTVAYFERLRFESSLRFSNPVVYQGDTLTASLTASYLSGGGLSGAPYTWHLTREPAGHVPGGAEGMWRNWHFGPELSDGRSFVSQGQGTLNQDGKADISNETGSDGTEGAVYRYRYEASVQDAARQEIAANAAILAHPASFYIAARLDPGTSDKADSANPSAFFLNALNPAALSWALVSPEGTAWRDQHAQEISIQLVRHEWKQARQAGV
ncbi:MAG: MG2 domain-containing protein, partial [Treponema sp.]|nr:MG2 domain-containing protein [Treponema sp.]